MIHLPVLLVMVVACVNVGTLIYARTATREAEIAMRYALGASRGRIVTQLFLEALVLASAAAVVGLAAAHAALQWGVAAYYSTQTGGLPFWVDPGLKLKTVLYAGWLTVTGAGILGVLPAVKVTGLRVHGHVRNVGASGSTLRFGRIWTTAMVAQVALTVICLPPAMGIAHESWRDRVIRERFPAEEYLALRVGLDRESPAAGEERASELAARLDRVYRELERRVTQEPDVIGVTFADRLPGMSPVVRRAEVEASAGTAPMFVPNLWASAVGPRFF
jgi:putative ABC transport system permease protein